MPRQSARLRLRSSPLVMVLSQVRISRLLAMKEYVPAIQEQLRRHGYPRFQVQQVHEVKLGPEPQFAQRERWLFADRDNREAVVLTEDFVVLETSRYDAFEDFTERFKAILKAVGAAIDAAATIVERIGLRYVDLILPAPGETLDDYLQPKLHGLCAGELEIDKVLNRFEARGTTKAGQLVVRLHQNEQGAPLPPDLFPPELDLGAREIPPGSVVTLLDIDHYSAQSRDYDPPSLINGLWQLHEYTEKAFLSSVTETALERWGKE